MDKKLMGGSLIVAVALLSCVSAQLTEAGEGVHIGDLSQAALMVKCTKKDATYGESDAAEAHRTLFICFETTLPS